MESNYIISAVKAQQFPQHDWPEFAFVGKSNCGKSSLLNALFQRKALARTSSTPGRTQMINFFSLKTSPEKSFVFADLPGYGFSRTARSVKASWDKMMSTYLEKQRITKLLFLFDARRSIEDYELAYLKEMQEFGHNIVIVLTKVDKLSQSDKTKNKKKLKEILKENELEDVPAIFCSTIKKTGLRELQKLLFEEVPSQ